MQLAELPDDVSELLLKLEAPPRLVAHLRLVHDVAVKLLVGLDSRFGDISIQKYAVLFGAATHDIGKAFCRSELSEPGCEHELRGREILLAAGYPEHLARFAFTHGGARREQNPAIEDTLVRLADCIWKGSRNHQLEMELVQSLCAASDIPVWEGYRRLDDLLSQLADEATERLIYQAQHPL